MSDNVRSKEQPVALGDPNAGPQVRNVSIKPSLLSQQQVLQQVVTLANNTGNETELNWADLAREQIALLTEIRRELMIMNELLIEGLNLRKVDLDKQYRNDPYYYQSPAVTND